MTLSHVTVALSFIPGSTHPRHGSSPAYAGLLHTNEYLREHEKDRNEAFMPRKSTFMDATVAAEFMPDGTVRVLPT